MNGEIKKITKGKFTRTNEGLFCHHIDEEEALKISDEFGYPGYEVYLKPQIEEWYLNKQIPNKKWWKNCYDKSFLNPEKAFEVLKEMQRIIGEKYHKSISDYYEEIERLEQKRQEWIEKRKREAEKEWNDLIKSTNELHEKSSRKDIVYTYYRLQYDKPVNVFNIGSEKTYEEFDKEMKHYPKDEILEKIKGYVNDISDE